MKKDKLPRITIRGIYYGKNRTLPGLNDYIDALGTHPKAGAKFKADYSKPIVSAIRRCLRGWKVTHPPVILHYKFFENSKGKRRDVDNIFACCAKFLQDALQDTGTLENDNPDWVCGFTADFEWITGEPYIQIEIEEVGHVEQVFAFKNR